MAYETLPRNYSFDPHPVGFRPEDFVGDGRADGFLPVSTIAQANGLTMDQAIRAIHRKGWELRAYGGFLYYRPAIVTRMGG